MAPKLRQKKKDFPDVFTRVGDETGPIMSWISAKIQENGGAVFCTGDYKKHEEYVEKSSMLFYCYCNEIIK